MMSVMSTRVCVSIADEKCILKKSKAERAKPREDRIARRIRGKKKTFPRGLTLYTAQQCPDTMLPTDPFIAIGSRYKRNLTPHTYSGEKLPFTSVAGINYCLFRQVLSILFAAMYRYVPTHTTVLGVRSRFCATH